MFTEGTLPPLLINLADDGVGAISKNNTIYTNHLIVKQKKSLKINLKTGI